MRITILALGSQGDVQPLFALGKGLATAGHQVRLATHGNYADLVTAHELAFHRLPGDARAIIQGEAGQALAASGHNVLRNLPAILRSFGALAEDYLVDLNSPALWETDAVINQVPGGLFGIDLAEKRAVPYFSAAVMPLARTRQFPLLFFPRAPAVIPGYNALTYRLGEQLAWQPFRKLVNRWRRETLGLPGVGFLGPSRRVSDRCLPALNGFSEHVVPRPPDWGAHIHVTGYWFLDESDWEPSSHLRDFLAAGPPPVYIGFGSMPVSQVERLTDLILEALDLTGLRAVLSAGWGIPDGRSLPESVLRINYVPYRWLFPRMAALVHHGGSGTTAAGLRAGVPTVVTPFVMDQYYWGARVAALGAGPPPIPFRRLTAERLAGALQAATRDQGLRDRAASLGARLRAEDGVANAVQVIEHTLGA